MSDPSRRPDAADGEDPILAALVRSAALRDVGRYDEAERAVRAGLTGAPEDPRALTELARVVLLQGRHREAQELAETAVRHAVDDPNPLMIRALALAEDGRRRWDAASAAEHATSLAPEDPAPWLVLSRVTGRSGWCAESLDAADRALALDPELAEAHDARGLALLRLDRAPEAERSLRTALRLDPGNAGYRNNLALAASRLGRREEAHRLFEDAARADPRDGIARENLTREARSLAYGGWGLGIAVFALFRVVLEAADGAWTAVGVWAVVAAVAIGFVVVRARRALAELSPGARRLLAEQRWWNRTGLRDFRFWWMLVPAPVWFVVSGVVALAAAVSLVRGPGDVEATVVVLVVALVVAGPTGRRTWRRHVEPRVRLRRRRP